MIDTAKWLGLDPWTIIDTWTWERWQMTQARLSEHAKRQESAQKRATGKMKLVDWLRENKGIG